MTPTRLTVPVLGALGLGLGVGVLAILIWAVATPGRHSILPAGAAAGAPARRPIDPTRPPAGSPSFSPPPSPASPAPPIPSPGRAAAAEPFVQTFAAQPGVRPLARVPSPTAKLSQPVNIDGCDHSYGERTQCVPWAFPPGTTDKCAWLKAHGFDAVKVLGKDRHHLDPDGDGIACDS